MQDNQPSKTAWKVALRRAAHQVQDSPRVLEDDLAVRLVGEDAVEEFLRREDNLPPRWRMGSRALLAFVVARSRLAEDALAQAFAAGVRQYVVLGAGLDTFAYRHDLAGLRVFEVDHPATQGWKQALLKKARIEMPESLTFVAVDFEREKLPEKLRAAGFDEKAPTFFSWLGVTMYLSLESFQETVAFLAARPRGSAVVLDYAGALSELSPLERAAFDMLQARLVAAGEPFRLFLSSKEMHQHLRAAGFQQIEEWQADDINGRFFASREDDLRVEGRMGRLILARV